MVCVLWGRNWVLCLLVVLVRVEGVLIVWVVGCWLFWESRIFVVKLLSGVGFGRRWMSFEGLI